MSDVNGRIAADLIASCIERHLDPEQPASHADVTPPQVAAASQLQRYTDDRQDENASECWDRVVDFHGDVEVRIPPEEYEARVVKAQELQLFGSRRLVLTFEIRMSTYAGTRLKFICAFPRKAKGGSSKFVRAWTVANGKPPRRKDRLAISIFKDKLFLVRVRDVTTDRHQKKLANPYSIVDAIVGRLA
jgi:hypothetical protein